jgi:hypothetical protein
MWEGVCYGKENYLLGGGAGYLINIGGLFANAPGQVALPGA